MKIRIFCRAVLVYEGATTVKGRVETGKKICADFIELNQFQIDKLKKTATTFTESSLLPTWLTVGEYSMLGTVRLETNSMGHAEFLIVISCIVYEDIDSELFDKLKNHCLDEEFSLQVIQFKGLNSKSEQTIEAQKIIQTFCKISNESLNKLRSHATNLLNELRSFSWIKKDDASIVTQSNGAKTPINVSSHARSLIVWRLSFEDASESLFNQLFAEVLVNIRGQVDAFTQTPTYARLYVGALKRRGSVDQTTPRSGDELKHRRNKSSYVRREKPGLLSVTGTSNTEGGQPSAAKADMKILGIETSCDEFPPLYPYSA